MNQDDLYKKTVYFNPELHGSQDNSAPPYQGPARAPDAWQQQAAPATSNKTEVLRPRGPKVFAMLVVVDGPGEGQIFRLDPSHPTTIGRDYACDVPIDESAISRQHARIKLDVTEDGKYQFFIQDLATENGTEVNEKIILKHYLEDGDRIKLGRVVLAFKQI